MRLRLASRGDAEMLSDLAVRSKAHWGYDEAFLDACREELRVDPDESDRLRITIAEDDLGTVVGFSALVGVDDSDAELLSLFVEPTAIGSGVGSVLFIEVVALAKRLGFTRLRIESDPFAAPFYERRGACGSAAPRRTRSRAEPSRPTCSSSSRAPDAAALGGVRRRHRLASCRRERLAEPLS
jgi:GNAT superfamily N-acetyltransferase